MPTIPHGSKVLVSGANGYIAMWVVQSLLERGYIVRGTVRSADKGKFITDYFTQLGYGDKLEIVVVEDIVKVQYNPILDYSIVLCLMRATLLTGGCI